MNDQTVIDYLARFDRENITMQVRSKIIEQLPEGRPSQGDIAVKLNTSLRSLQRRLRDQDTSFKELLSNTQQELALSYIRDSSRSIGEITYLLGFSEPSNFTRAFKRWTGTPGCLHAKPDLVVVDTQDGHRDVVTDHDRLVYSARQYQHPASLHAITAHSAG